MTSKRFSLKVTPRGSLMQMVGYIFRHVQYNSFQNLSREPQYGEQITSQPSKAHEMSKATQASNCKAPQVKKASQVRKHLLLANHLKEEKHPQASKQTQVSKAAQARTAFQVSRASPLKQLKKNHTNNYMKHRQKFRTFEPAQQSGYLSKTKWRQ